MKYLKSTGAIFAGLITIFILAGGTDTILEKAGIFPSVEEQMKYGFNELWMQLLTLVYRFIFTVIGGFVTAILAPSHPMRHVYILMAISVVIGLIGFSVAASMGLLGIFPVWYSIALMVIGFPSLWIGGKLAEKKGNLATIGLIERR